MSYSVLTRINRGAYEFPFSGVGIEFYPLGGEFDRTGLIFHEAGYNPKVVNWNFPNVFSPFWRLYYNSKPGHCVKFGNKTCRLTPERIMLIPDHVLFHCIGSKTVQQFWFHFSINKQVSLKQSIPILHKPSSTELSLIKDTQKLILKNEEYKPTEQIYRHSLALLNIVMSKADIQWKAPLSSAIVEILNYVDDNITEDLSNQRLADYACMSIEGLSKMFRKHMGISPAAYVTQTKIKLTSQMLLQSNWSIDRIAAATGFANRNYFSRVFKRVTNESPAAFRKMHFLYKSTKTPDR